MASQSSPLSQKDDSPFGAETRQAFHELKADFASLQEDLREVRKDMMKLSATGAADVKGTFDASMSKAKGKASDAAEMATSELHEVQHQAQNAIRKNPLSAVAAALAIGYFVGALARR